MPFVRNGGDAHAERATSDVRAGGALEVCVEIAALGPQSSVEHYVGAAHRRIAEALGSSSGYVGVAVRCRPPAGDALRGWRLPVFYAIGGHSRTEMRAVEQELREETYLRDPVVKTVIDDAGRHRVYHDRDPRKEPARAETLDMKYWLLLGLVDRLKVVLALAEDVEIHFSVDRAAGSSRFGPREVLLAEDMTCGLGPWAERLALLHGYLADRAPLTPREREMTCALLGRAPLKEIAGALGIGEARARELVRAVYRKLLVGSRAELASTWAGPHAAPIVQPIATSRVSHPLDVRRRVGSRRGSSTPTSRV